MVVSILTGKEAPERKQREPTKPEPTDLEKALAALREMVDGLKASGEANATAIRAMFEQLLAAMAADQERMRADMREASTAHGAAMAAKEQALMVESAARHQAERELAEVRGRLQALESTIAAAPKPAPAAPVEPKTVRLAPAEYKFKVTRNKDGQITDLLMKRE